MNSKYKDKAIPLIAVDQATGKYNLTAEASEFLRSVPGPIGVVSVAGLYRTGKSYLLNQMLLNRSSGFGVGPTVNPCTKGLWCWGTPIKGQTPNGEKLNIIVIDTEGIGALDEDQTHDTRIFTLAILASSCFIYNSVGSIDETAVQNLSLVVNLTKHIQLRTDKSGEEQDPDKIASYFPSFFWVVRDFSLQIVDPEGNKMSSKEYLEKALAPHKGFTDDIEEKNRIRRMLTSFFKDRECFTLVRPLIDQSKLQDLDKMNFEDLRPEFVNQVINFRKRVISCMKPKILNGQKLNGQLYLNMLSSYVGAINDGAVPNIENAWNYMCQEQYSKVMAESMEVFMRKIQQIKIPCLDQKITEEFEAAEELAYQIFKQKSIGEDSDKYWRELKEKMKTVVKQLRENNVKVGKQAFKKFATPLVVAIQQKISRDQYASVEEFLQELTKVEQKINNENLKLVDVRLNCQLFTRKIMNQGVLYLSKRMKNQKEHIRQTLEERAKLNEVEMQNLKKQRETEESKNRQKFSQFDKQKVDLIFKLEKLQFELDRTTKERSSQGQLLTKNLNAKKMEVEQMRKQFELQVSEANNRVEEMLKNLHQQQSNWEKERAIYELKVKQQTERIDQLEKKRQIFDSKLALQTNDLMQKNREQTMKLQEQIQELHKNLAETRQKYQQMTKRYEEMSQKYTNVNEKYEGTERKLREETNSKAREMQKLRNEHETELNRIKNQLLQNEDEKMREGRELEQKYKKQELKAKELEQTLKNTKGKYERQNQVLIQDLQFAKKNYEDTKQKMLEMKSFYESKIEAMELDNGLQRQEQVQKKITEMKAAHQDDLRNAQNQFKQNQRILNLQIENLTKIRNELELKLKVSAEQLANERYQSEEAKKILTCKTEQLENQIKQMQREKSTELLSKQGLFNQKLAALESELQQTRQNFYSQKSQMQIDYNNKITQLKNYYDLERQTLETKISDERDKLKKKYNQTVQEYEKKLQEQSENYQEEIQRLESQYLNENRTLNTTVIELTHQRDTLERQKLGLEEKLDGLGSRYAKMETQLNERIQKLMESSRTEKQYLTKKLQELQQTKNQMEKEFLSLTHERDQYKGQTLKQSSQIEELKYQNSGLTERFETTKKTLQEKLKDVQGNYMRDKSKFETDVALLQQKKDFAEQKIVELESDLKTTREREQEQIKQLKQRSQEEILNLTTKATSERKFYEEKLDKLKKQLTETESTLMKQLSEITKSKAVDEQKIEFLEKKLNDTETKRQTQVDSLSEQLRAFREKANLEKTQLKARVEELEQLVHKKESQITEQKNQYQIQVALADSKIRSQTQWLQSAISEKVEMIRNLEKQLDESRKRNENEKSTQQLTHQQILSRMQSKYRNQITQLSQDVTKRTQEIQYMAKQHERTIKDLNEKLAVERQTRVSLETKIARVENDYIQRQTKLTADIDKLRAQKDAQSLETQKLIAKQKQNYKTKLAEYERRTSETDKLKQQALFEKEKQEAKWKMQRNSLEEKLEELRENLDREKNETKKLLKDNEKLKAEKKKNSSFINIKNQTTFLPREVGVENKENSQMQ